MSQDDDEAKNGLLRALRNEEQWSNTYLRSELANAQITALQRYYGDEYGDEVEGRSRVTTREVYETIEWLRPDLKRVFTAGERVCEFEGVSEAGDQFSNEASDYINHVFLVDNPGERRLDEFIFDGLLHRRGVIAAEWKEEEFHPAQEVSGLNSMQAEQLMQLAAQGQLKIEGQEVEQYPPDEAHPDGLFYEFKIRKLQECGKPEIFTIAPEDFRIAARAVDLETARYCGDIVRMMKGEAKKKWPEYAEEIDSGKGATSAFATDDRRAERFRDVEGWDSSQMGNSSDDGEAGEVEILREYIRYDMDGDGYPEMIRVYRLEDCILEHEEVDEHIYGSWTPIPIPHRFYGLSVADEAADLQRTKTVLLRGMLDSVYLSVVPRVIARTGVNLDDLLVVTPGAVVRDDSPGGGGVTPMVTPDLSQSALAAMQWVDRILESRTGVTRQAQGFDPDALHDTARGMELMQNAQSVRKEEIARNLADGLQAFFAKLYRLVHKHQNQARAVKIAGKWRSVDPRAWEADMRCTVSVGLGTGAREKQLVMLGMLQGDQGLAFQTFGPQNPSVGPMELYNMVEEKGRIIGYKSIDRFFKRPMIKDPQTGEEKPWTPQPQPDPEQQKLQQQAQIEQMKIQAQERQTVLQAQKDMEVASAQQRDEVMRAEMDFRANEQASMIEAEKLRLQAEEAARTHEREMLRMQIEAQQAAADMELKRVELQIKQQELGLRAQEVADRGTIEREKLADGKEARKTEFEMRKAEAKDKPKEEPKANGSDRSGEAIGKGLEALASAMSRPKTIRRGADGKPEGIE